MPQVMKYQLLQQFQLRLRHRRIFQTPILYGSFKNSYLYILSGNAVEALSLFTYGPRDISFYAMSFLKTP